MNAQEIREELKRRIEDLAPVLLPGGKRHGNSWHAGSIRGGEGDSLRVQLTGSKAGVWMDGATSEKGGPIDLWMATRGSGSFAAALDEIRAYIGVPRTVKRPEAAHRSYEKPQETWAEAGKEVIAYLGKRGISMETVRSAKIGQSGKETIVFPYHDETGDLVMAKYISTTLDAKGKKKCWSSASPKPILFGMRHPLVAEHRGSITITEGEIDCLSWLERGYPAVSIPAGAAGENAQGESKMDLWIENCFEWLQQFHTIYVSMDMDDVGIAARDAIIKRLGRERCRAITLPMKDANDCLKAGQFDPEKLMLDADTIDPADMRTGISMMESVWEAIKDGPAEGRGFIPFGWPDIGWKIREREGTVITGFNGAGKSNFCYQLFAWLAAVRGEHCFIGSYEEPGKTILSIMMRHAAGRQIGARERVLYERYAPQLLENISIDDREGGEITAKDYFERATYSVRRYGTKYALLDSATCLDVNLEDKEQTVKFAKDCQKFWKETGAHLFLLCHPRKGADEKKPPLKMDVKGTGTITDLFFNVVTVFKREDGDSELIVSKNKVEGIPGNCVTTRLCYSQKSRRLSIGDDDDTPYFTEETIDEIPP